MVSYESERTIKMVWRLRYVMPMEMFEDNRRDERERRILFQCTDLTHFLFFRQLPGGMF